MDTPLGRPTVLTAAEELQLVEHIQNMADIGFPLTTDDFLGEVAEIVKAEKRPNPFKDGKPGTFKWLQVFESVHSLCLAFIVFQVNNNNLCNNVFL